jgi:hypothetical protein
MSALQKIIARLEEWAAWYSRVQDCGLGYPSTSLEYRMLRCGRTSRSAVIPVQPSHEAAEEIEQWVCEMAQENPLMARTLRCYYFYAGGLKQHAARLKISPTQCRLYLNMAQQWLVGRSIRNY